MSTFRTCDFLAAMIVLLIFTLGSLLEPSSMTISTARAADDDSIEATESFDYFSNNWNVIGLKDYDHGTRVTPDNRLQLEDALVQIRTGRNLAPLSRRQGKRVLDGWIPVVLITTHDGPVRYDIQLWATPLPTVNDWKKAFDWPTEGENFLNWIRVKAVNTGDEPTEARLTTFCSRPDANESFRWQLKPGDCEVATIRVPFSSVEDPSGFAEADPDVWFERTVDYWKGIFAQAARIEVPCVKATEALMAAHVCQLIANDHGEVHGGEGFYDQLYIRDGAYQIMELEEAGLTDAAGKAIEYYLKKQLPDGRFTTQGGQLDANGQAQWALWQYYRITGDQAFLARAYPQMLRATEWTIQARRAVPADSPYVGVLPNALADGEFLWDGKYHIVGYDIWNLRGMLCTADAARILGKKAEAEAIREEAALYREAIDAVWKRARLAHFPPSWEKAGTHWGNTETLWPTELFDRDDPRMIAMTRHVREDFCDGFVEGTIQWNGRRRAIHPYMGAYTTMSDLALGGHEKVVQDFYWYLLHSTAAHAFPEGIYPQTREAWSNTIPHVTGASNYALMLRHMLIHEIAVEGVEGTQCEDLHLLKAVPDWWLDPGQEIHAQRVPTHFGMMTLCVRGTADGVEVTLEPPKRNPPKRIVLHLPESRPLVGKVDGGVGVEVVTRSNQKQRWDFQTVVTQYEQSDPPPLWTKPDAISLTTDKPVTCSTALPGRPAGLANDGCAKVGNRYWAMDVSDGDPAWWQVDLMEPTTVGRVVVVGFYGDERYYGFTVETSLDGKAWDMVADRRDNTELSTAKGYACPFDPRQVRHIRVTQTINSANTGRHLVEVMAYEE